MRAPRQSLLTMEPGRSGRPMRGMVLVELGFFLLVVALAFTLFSVGIGRIRHEARLGQLASDLRAFAQVFEQARAESGRWPATADEVSSRLLDTSWGRGSPFGGAYGWVPPGPAGRPGMITLTAFSPGFPLGLTRADLLALDRRIDDGDLATGRFRTGFNGWPVYLVGGKP